MNDVGDNMVTNVEPFKDDFNDGNYTGWTVGWGAWTATNNFLEPTGAGWNGIRQSTTDADNEVSLAYNINDTSDSNYRLYVYPRYVDSSNFVWVRIYPGKIELGKVVSGTWTTLGTYTVTSSANTWYDLRIVCNGSNVQVWRTVSGSMAVKILESSSAGVTTANYVLMENSPGSSFDIDNVRILSDDLSSTATFGYTSANELTTMTDPNGTTSFTYDAWGRMTGKSQGSYSASYAYRYGDKLYSVSSDFPGEGGVTYQYGADQKRRERTVGGVTTKYRYDLGWNAINEDSNGGTLQNTFVYTPRGQVGTMLADIAGATPSSGTTRYYFQDNIGSTRLLCDASKVAIGVYDYEPYGSTYADNGASVTFKFTGKPWDSSAQLYYFPYRFYDPDLGRWLSRDPLGMDAGPNVYGYVSGEPLSRSDLLGLDYIKFHRRKGFLEWIYTETKTVTLYDFYVGAAPHAMTFAVDAPTGQKEIWNAHSGKRKGNGKWTSQIPKGKYYTTPEDLEPKEPYSAWGPYAYRLHRTLFTYLETWFDGYTAGWFIHGGVHENTAGCIELSWTTDQSDTVRFHKQMQSYGKKIYVYVEP